MPRAAAISVQVAPAARSAATAAASTARVGDQRQGGGGVSGDRAGLLGGVGEVFGADVQPEFACGLSEVFGLVVQVAAAAAGVELALVAAGDRAPVPGAAAGEGPAAFVAAVLAGAAAAPVRLAELFNTPLTPRGGRAPRPGRLARACAWARVGDSKNSKKVPYAGARRRVPKLPESLA